jgi:4-carboxymuconolactone decarboxylase
VAAPVPDFASLHPGYVLRAIIRCNEDPMAEKKTNKKPTKEATKKPAKKPVKALPYRLPALTEDTLDVDQRTLLSSMRAGPRGDRVKLGGPFGVYMHAPQYGDLMQQLGAFVRYKTSLEPRLSEFAILCTARLWRAQYEWHAHAPIAEKAGVKAEAIADIKAGRTPKKAAKDERAIYDFVQELYKKRRVSERTYKKLQGFLGDKGAVELTGILGYYAGVSMTLNVFNVPLPEDAAPYFPEPK